MVIFFYVKIWKIDFYVAIMSVKSRFFFCRHLQHLLCNQKFRRFENFNDTINLLIKKPDLKYRLPQNILKSCSIKSPSPCPLGKDLRFCVKKKLHEKTLIQERNQKFILFRKKFGSTLDFLFFSNFPKASAPKPLIRCVKFLHDHCEIDESIFFDSNTRTIKQ